MSLYLRTKRDYHQRQNANERRGKTGSSVTVKREKPSVRNLTSNTELSEVRKDGNEKRRSQHVESFLVLGRPHRGLTRSNLHVTRNMFQRPLLCLLQFMMRLHPDRSKYRSLRYRKKFTRLRKKSISRMFTKLKAQ